MPAPKFEVQPFSKGGFAVLLDGDLITRVPTREAGETYIASLSKKPTRKGA